MNIIGIGYDTVHERDFEIKRPGGYGDYLLLVMKTPSFHVLEDRKQIYPAHCAVLYDQTTPTVIFTDKMVGNRTNMTFVKLDFTQSIVPQILDYLYQTNLSSLIVEGGTQLLQAFIDARLWDEVHIETSPEIIGAGVKAPNISMKIIDTKWYDQNKMVIGIPEA